MGSDLLHQYPKMLDYLDPRTTDKLLKVPRRGFELPNVFGPTHPGHELSLPLEPSQVSFIDQEAQLDSISLQGEVVGLDCEWKPTVLKFQNCRVSLMQVAFEDRVYILDLLKLNQSQKLDTMLTELFQSQNTLKVGVGFINDKNLGALSYPHMKCFTGEIKKHIDLVHLFQEVNGASPGGLAGLCELVLGLPLSKVEQRSNWEKRPLRLSQLHYASLDAHCQLQIFDSLQFKINELGTSVDYYCENLSEATETLRESGTGFSCELCGSKMHNKSQCHRGPKCKICQEHGHIARNCHNGLP